MPVRHIGVVGAFCHAPPDLGLRLQARSGSDVFTIANDSDVEIRLYYDWTPSFGDYQMFFIRFRDWEGNVFDPNSRGCGWWSPKVNDNTIYPPDRWPERRSLVIPARDRIDIARDFGALTEWLRRGEPLGLMECEMQVRLYGYLQPQTWDAVGADSEWIPAPCPPESRTERLLRELM